MYFPGDVVRGGILSMGGCCPGGIAHGGIMSGGMLSMGDNVRWGLNRRRMKQSAES